MSNDRAAQCHSGSVTFVTLAARIALPILAHMPTAIAVMIIEAHPLVRRALATRLARDPAMRVVAATEHIPSTAEIAQARPDVILYGISGRWGREDTHLLDGIAHLAQHAPVIVLSSYQGGQAQQALQEAGAAAYFLKTIDTPELIAQIKRCVVLPDGSHPIAPAASPL